MKNFKKASWFYFVIGLLLMVVVYFAGKDPRVLSLFEARKPFIELKRSTTKFGKVDLELLTSDTLLTTGKVHLPVSQLCGFNCGIVKIYTIKNGVKVMLGIYKDEEFYEIEE